jgi:hypothetical protein
MKQARIVFGEVNNEPQQTDSQDGGFSMLGEDEDDDDAPPKVTSSRPVVSPWILKLFGVSLLAVFLLFWFAPASAQMIPIEKVAREGKVMERYNNYRAQVAPNEPPEAAQALQRALERQLHAVARSEAVGNKALARKELSKLMLLDGGDTRSPLYKFCVERSKEYR